MGKKPIGHGFGCQSVPAGADAGISLCLMGISKRVEKSLAHARISACPLN
uniref:Uncharacterized protein n=1 Tax=Arundo donax TaxID=35708 RepID=A0A0A9HLD4_ARUDO